LLSWLKPTNCAVSVIGHVAVDAAHYGMEAQKLEVDVQEHILTNDSKFLIHTAQL
jgi:hypothetical protein